MTTTRLLYEGTQGDDVFALQVRLNQWLMRNNQPVIATNGRYDAATIQAVRALQQDAVSKQAQANAQGSAFTVYDVDGVVGPRTAFLLDNLEAQQQKDEPSYEMVQLGDRPERRENPFLSMPRVNLPTLELPPLPSIPDFSLPVSTARAGVPTYASGISIDVPAPRAPAETVQFTAAPVTVAAPAPVSRRPRVAANEPIVIVPEDIVPEGKLEEWAAKAGMSPEAMQRGLELSVRNINTVHPEMRAALALGSRASFERGQPVVMADGHRGGHAQDRAHRRGTSGARAGQSYHNYSLGADFYPMDATGQPEMEWRTPGFVDTISNLRRTMEQEFGLGTLKMHVDPGHFTFWPERNQHGMQGMSARRFVREAGANPAECDGKGEFLQIPERLVPPRIRRATEQLRAERNPEPPRAREPERARMEVADAGENGVIENIASTGLRMGRNLLGRVGIRLG